MTRGSTAAIVAGLFGLTAASAIINSPERVKERSQDRAHLAILEAEVKVLRETNHSLNERVNALREDFNSFNDGFNELNRSVNQLSRRRGARADVEEAVTGLSYEILSVESSLQMVEDQVKKAAISSKIAE